MASINLRVEHAITGTILFDRISQRADMTFKELKQLVEVESGIEAGVQVLCHEGTVLGEKWDSMLLADYIQNQSMTSKSTVGSATPELGSEITLQLIKAPKRIRHAGLPDNGGYVGCGGNPKGLARCSGAGNCSKDCRQCGAGTHWRCCGSSDQTSEFCLLWTTPEQAETNAHLCYTSYDPTSPSPVYIIEDLPSRGCTAALPESCTAALPESCTAALPGEQEASQTAVIMHLIVEHGLNGDELCALALKSVDISVAELKRLIEDQTSIKIRSQVLCWDGKSLDATYDMQPLRDALVILPENMSSSEMSKPPTMTISLIKVTPRVEHIGWPQSSGWSGCGGNPKGIARCEGNGNCSPACQECGRGTHWRCCGSSDRASQFCVFGTTMEQAQTNTDLCYSYYCPTSPGPAYVLQEQDAP
jgi:hypothetical protein